MFLEKRHIMFILSFRPINIKCFLTFTSLGYKVIYVFILFFDFLFSLSFSHSVKNNLFSTITCQQS